MDSKSKYFEIFFSIHGKSPNSCSSVTIDALFQRHTHKSKPLVLLLPFLPSVLEVYQVEVGLVNKCNGTLFGHASCTSGVCRNCCSRTLRCFFVADRYPKKAKNIPPCRTRRCDLRTKRSRVRSSQQTTPTGFACRPIGLRKTYRFCRPR